MSTSKPLGLREQRKAETRQQILQAAIQVFEQAGFEGASTREIAKRAGVAQGLLTYHFENKDKLWREAVKAAFAELPELPELPPDAGIEQVRQAFRACIRGYAQLCLRSSGMAMLLYQQSGQQDERFDWLVREQFLPSQQRLRPLYEACQTTGLVKPMPFEHFCFSLAGLSNTYFALAGVYRIATSHDPQDATVSAAIIEHIEALMLR
ncbi:MAG TPA: TetR/AcrR family transcriptional regulator [Pseudomonas sp.]|nr:TetR/AcrR family transcriptional regulator [Pseudomonas sp.]